MKLTGTIKQLELVRPEMWRVCRIDDLAVRGTGHTPDKKVRAYWNGDVSWVSLTDCDRLDRVYISETTKCITQKGIDNSSAVLHPAGIVLMSRDAGVGQSAITTRPMAVSQHFVTWQCGDKLNNLYLYYWLQLLKPEFERIANGSTIKTIGMPYFSSLGIMCPNVEEQQAISQVLLNWGQCIRQLTDLIAAKLRFKQGLMQQLLTGLRQFPEFTATSFIELHIGDVLQETFRPVVWDDDELYRLAGIRRHSGGLFWREALLGKHIKVKRLYTLQPGDFLISQRQAAYGAMGVVPVEFAGGKVSPEYAVLSPKYRDRIDMRYIGYLSEMKRMRHQAYLSCNGFFAERLRLNFDPAEFLKQRILLPESRKEQAKIADLLDSLVDELNGLKQQLDRLRRQKRGLMQKLLTGEVRVKVPMDASPANGGH